MIPNAIERLSTQVQRYECLVSSPDGVVVSLGEIRAEGIFAGVPARPVPAVMSDGNGFGEGHIQSERTRNGSSDLSNFEGMGEAGALMVVGEYEDLCFAGEAAKCTGMKDAITVALEARSERVGFLVKRSIARPNCTCRKHGEVGVFEFLTALSV